MRPTVLGRQNPERTLARRLPPSPSPALHGGSEPPGPWETLLDELRKRRVLNLRPYVVARLP